MTSVHFRKPCEDTDTHREDSRRNTEAKTVVSCSIVSDSVSPQTVAHLSMGFSVHGILQERPLEWTAIPFSRGSSQPRDWTWVSCIAVRFFTIWAHGVTQLPAKGCQVLRANTTSSKMHRRTLLESSEGAWHWQHLDFRLLAAKTMKEEAAIVLSHQPVKIYHSSLGN